MIRGHRRVDARTETGPLYHYWTRDLPPIPSHFLYSVAYLYPNREDAKRGERVGGSGFLAYIPRDLSRKDSLGFFYIVTVRHVAERAGAARLTSVPRPPVRGKTELFDTPPSGWHHHPDGDDVSVFPLGLSAEAESRFLGINRLGFVDSRRAVSVGDDVFFLGRYIVLDGRAYNVPVARFGHVAMGGTAKMYVRERGIEQESFLVEALSLSGYSGSPVLAFRLHVEAYPFPGDPGVRVRMGEPEDRETGIHQQIKKVPVLLGIDWGHFNDEADVLQVDRNPDPAKLHVEQNTGFAGVVPAWKISEILDSEELEEMRAQQRKEQEQKTKGQSGD